MRKKWRRLKRPKKCGQVVLFFHKDQIGPCGQPAPWSFPVSGLAPFYRCLEHKRFHDTIVKAGIKAVKHLWSGKRADGRSRIKTAAGSPA